MTQDFAAKYRSKVDITEKFLHEELVQKHIGASGLDVKVFLVGDSQRELYQGGWGATRVTNGTGHIFMFERALTLSDEGYFGYLASSVGYVLAVADMVKMVPVKQVDIVLQQFSVQEVRMALGDSLAADYFGVDVVPSRVEMYKSTAKSDVIPFNFLKYLANLEKLSPETARRIRKQTVQSKWIE